MPDVFDENGERIGVIPLSEQQLRMLKSGCITVYFHTPQLLHHLLGTDSGSFEIGRNDKGDIVVRAGEVAKLKRFIDLQSDIKRASES